MAAAEQPQADLAAAKRPLATLSTFSDLTPPGPTWTRSKLLHALITESRRIIIGHQVFAHVNDLRIGTMPIGTRSLRM